MKKTYIQPQVVNVKIYSQSILAGSVVGIDVIDGTADGSVPSLVKGGEQIDQADLNNDGAGSGFSTLW